VPHGALAGLFSQLQREDHRFAEGGCYVDAIAQVVSSEALILKILLSDNHWLDLPGVVAHVFPRLGFGVRFVNLDEKQRRLISPLINQTDVPSADSDPGEAFVVLAQLDLPSRGAI